MSILTFTSALGLDSLLVSIPLGMVVDGRIKRRRLALTFGVCDGIAMLFGAAFASNLPGLAASWTHEIGPALLALYGCYVFGLGWYGHRAVRDGGTLLVLAIMLSFDNFIVGAMFGGLNLSTTGLALIAGFISGTMALVGFGLGALLVGKVPVRLRLAGPLLILAACLLLLARK